MKNEASVDGDGRDGYRSYNSHYPSNKPGERGRILGCSIYSLHVYDSVHNDKRSRYWSHTSHLTSNNRGGKRIPPPGYPQDYFPWGGLVEMIQNSHQGYYFYPQKIILIILIQA